MCNICNKLKQEQKIKIPERSTYAEDNFCEYINDTSCDLCDQCGDEFHLQSYIMSDTGDIHGSIDFRREIKDVKGEKVVVHAFTEGIKLNFCFNCGEQLSIIRKGDRNLEDF